MRLAALASEMQMVTDTTIYIIPHGRMNYINRKDGSGFDDSTKLSNLYYPGIRSNGCQFFDIDNDGDNDLYVSTLGDKRFYLYVNDGSGRFEEDAERRGLGNVVRQEAT